MTAISQRDREHALDYLDRLKSTATGQDFSPLCEAFADRAAAERASLIKWVVTYGDEIKRAIAGSPEGPLRTSLMGEFAATVAIRQTIEHGWDRKPPDLAARIPNTPV